jgi:hypothetical protein
MAQAPQRFTYQGVAQLKVGFFLVFKLAQTLFFVILRNQE